jgi:CDGSH-type Zn-finger protein/uncharacterized Fe-S cluster protein YjdI
MGDRARTYDGTSIKVVYDAARCIHAAECVRGLPEVFDPDRRPWIDPSRAEAEAIADVVTRCPTGALAYERLDGGAAEAAAAVNTVTVSADGPLFLRGRVVVRRSDGTERDEKRLALCRCGASAHKPECDGNHHGAAFTDPGDVAKRGDAAADPAGTLTVAPQPNGPAVARGQFALIDGSGAERGVFDKAAFCRCGASRSKPFCDGSHVTAGFTAD